VFLRVGIGGEEYSGLPERQSSRDYKMGNEMKKLNAKRLFISRRIFKLLRKNKMKNNK
jgi:hypothetical protein